MIICGQFPSRAMTFNLSIVSALPTTSSSTCGRYFSTLSLISIDSLSFGITITHQGSSYGVSAGPVAFTFDEDDMWGIGKNYASVT